MHMVYQENRGSYETIQLCFSRIICTAVEFVVDLITKDYHELAKKAKDTAASSVVLASIVALAIGVIVFLPYLIK